MPVLAPLHPRFDDVRKIAVLRGGGLGDLLFALPAVDALAAAYPGAEITLLGTPLHGELLREVPGSVDRVEVLPVAHGVREVSGRHEQTSVVDAFVSRMREHGFDLAVQVHGGGRFSNAFLSRLGARHTVGAATPDALPLERSLPYLYYQHEVLRALEIVGLAGAEPVNLEPTLVAPEGSVSIPSDDRRVVVIHPGASDPRRRWPAERFARVARALVNDGVRVVLVGEGPDVATAQKLVARLDHPLVTSLAGRLSLADLARVFARADVVLGNDSGPRHLAAAVGARTVGIFWFGNALNAAPLGRGRHRVQLSYTTHCPVCGRDATQVGWTATRCEHDVSFVTDVRSSDVLADVQALLDGR